MNKLSKRRHGFKYGFTLIELLVVISVIGLLASMVVVSVNRSREKARYAKAKADINLLRQLMMSARIASGKTLRQITGSYCSECACRSKGNIHQLPQTDSCFTTSAAVIASLNAVNSGITVDTSLRDPWGGPYLFNENEGEACCCPDTVTWCCTDNIMSYGPDGLGYNSDDVNLNVSTVCSPTAGSHHPNTNWNP